MVYDCLLKLVDNNLDPMHGRDPLVQLELDGDFDSIVCTDMRAAVGSGRVRAHP